MAKTRVLLIGFLALLLIALPLLGACTKEVVKEVPVEKIVEKEVIKEVAVKKGAPVKISQEFGLTGPYAPQHKHIFRAYQDYVRYVNEVKGGLPDTEGVLHPVELIWGDMKMSAPTSISLYEKAKAAGALVHGAVWVAATVAIKPKSDKDKMPLFNLSASNSAIVPQGYGYILLPYYEDIVGAYVDWFLESWDKPNPPKLAMIAIDNPFGRTIFQKNVLAYIESKGVEVVAKELVDLIPVDVTPNLTKIQNAGADFLYGQIVSPTAAVIARDMVKLGIEIPRAGCPPMGYASLAAMAGEAAEGWITAAWTPFLGDDPGIKLGRELQMKYHEEVLEEDQYALGMTTVQALVEVARLTLEKVPFDEITHQKVWEFGVNRMKDFDTGIVPPITLGVESGYYGQRGIRLVQIKGGKGVIASDWITTPDVLGYGKYYETQGKKIALEQVGK